MTTTGVTYCALILASLGIQLAISSVIITDDTIILPGIIITDDTVVLPGIVIDDVQVLKKSLGKKLDRDVFAEIQADTERWPKPPVDF